MPNHLFQAVAVADAAARLGVSKKTIYALQSDPRFPRIFKVCGRKSAILAHELDAWLADRRVNHRIDGLVDQEIGGPK